MNRQKRILAALVVTGLVIVITVAVSLTWLATRRPTTDGDSRNGLNLNGLPTPAQRDPTKSSKSERSTTDSVQPQTSNYSVEQIKDFTAAILSTLKINHGKPDHLNMKSVLPGWFTLDSDTTYRYGLYQESKSFFEAKAICEEQGAVLAANGIRNGREMKKILEIIADHGNNRNDAKPYIWIGLQQYPSNSTSWRWSDGVVSLESEIKSWGSGQPNHIKAKRMEECVTICTKNTNSTQVLHDCPCSMELRFICEISASS